MNANLENWLPSPSLRAECRENYWQQIVPYTTAAALLAISLQPAHKRVLQKGLTDAWISALTDFNNLSSLVAAVDRTKSRQHEEAKAYLEEILGYWEVNEAVHRDKQYACLLFITSEKVRAMSITPAVQAA